MLTERVIAWVDGHMTASPWTKETQALIHQYGDPSPPERQTQYHELALVVAHAIVMIPFILGLALAGALTSRAGIDGAAASIQRVGAAGLAWCCVGLAVHLIRYYSALSGYRTTRSRPVAAYLSRY